MSYDDWNMKLLSLSPKQFEELCVSLIQEMGFKNVIWRERGPDEGRDIEGQRIEILPDGYTEFIQKWFFECKLFQDSIPESKISSKLDWANLERIDKLAFMSNTHFSNQCREYLKKKETQIYPKIVDWTGLRFLNILFSKPSVCKSYFPTEEIPPQFLDKIDKNEVPSFIKDRLVSSGLKENMQLTQVANEFSINSDDPNFYNFIENNILTQKDLPQNFKSQLLQVLYMVSFAKHNFNKSLQYINLLMEIFPENELYINNKGIILEELDRNDESIRCFNDILQRNPRNVIALNNKGHHLDKKGQMQHALRCFERAIELAPKFELAIVNKTKILLKQNRKAEALRFIEQHLKELPRSYLLWNAKADVLLKQLDFKKALEAVNNSLEINPISFDSINNKGVILEHNGQFQFSNKYNDLALEEFKKVTQQAPYFELGWTNLLVCNENLKNHQEIERLYELLEEKFPNQSISLTKRAIALTIDDKYEAALKLLNEATSIDKTNYEANHKKGEIYLHLNKPKKAWRIARNYIQNYNDPEYNYKYYCLIANAYEAMKDAKKAAKWRTKAERIKPMPISLIE